MARDFDGTTQYASVSTPVLTAYPVTMAAWFRSDVASSIRTIIAITDAATAQGGIQLLLAANLVGDPISANVNGINAAISTTGITVGTWHHACGIWASATDRRAFIDGGSKGTNTNNATFPIGTDSTDVGARLQSTIIAFFNGRIAEAAIWSVALTDDEVAQLSRGVSPLRIQSQSLVAYWPLYGNGSPEPDYGGGVNNLTLTGSPPQADHSPRTQPPFGHARAWSGAFTAPPPPAGGGAVLHDLLLVKAG